VVEQRSEEVVVSHESRWARLLNVGYVNKRGVTTATTNTRILIHTLREKCINFGAISTPHQTPRTPSPPKVYSPVSMRSSLR
jgi:hypothetical protein